MGQRQKREKIGATRLGKITREQVERKLESNDNPEILGRGDTSEVSGLLWGLFWEVLRRVKS